MAAAPGLVPSALEKLIENPDPIAKDLDGSDCPRYLRDLTLQVLHNLQYQHRWTDLEIHVKAPKSGRKFARPLIYGLPPKRLYVHPDEQAEILKQEATAGGPVGGRSALETPVKEWVLPSHLKESWSLKGFAEVFDGLDAEEGKWKEIKRVLLSTVQDDSTVTYYFVHGGAMKPRQN